jgi:hypothetical protein
MSMLRYVTAGIVAATVLAAAPAQAVTQIPDGTVSTVGLFVPAITVGATSTYTAGGSVLNSGTTFNTAANGGFSGAAGALGAFNGVLNFSSSVGTTLTQSVANFFTFGDGTGHNFQFSVDSVKTVGYSISPTSNSFSLYLLGTTVDTFLGYGATATSLTLSFNSTGGSAYSTAATLAVPPSAPSVPEPATWAMTLIGFGAMGAALRRRPRTSVSFA